MTPVTRAIDKVTAVTDATAVTEATAQVDPNDPRAKVTAATATKSSVEDIDLVPRYSNQA